MRNIGPFTMRFFINLLLTAGAIALLVGFSIFSMFMVQALPKLHFLADGMLTLPLTIIVFIVSLGLFLMGTLHIGVALVLAALVYPRQEEEAVVEPGMNELHHAIVAKDVSAVRGLLEAGAAAESATARGKSALVLASEAGNAEIVRLLLANGALPNGRDDYGLKPLDAAVRCGHLEVVQLLIEAGASFSRQYFGKNHERIAKLWGRKDVLRYLKGLEQAAPACCCGDPASDAAACCAAPGEALETSSVFESAATPELTQVEAVAAEEEPAAISAQGLYAMIKPKTSANKLLVAGLWLQGYEKKASFSVEALESTLKEMGVTLRDPAATLKKLTAGETPLLETIQKSPRGKKTYRLSSEAAEGLIAPPA